MTVYPGSGSRAGPVKYKAEQDFTGQASSFRRRPESSVAARIAEEDKHRVKTKDYLLPKTKTFYRRGRRDRRGNQERGINLNRSRVTAVSSQSPDRA